MPVDFFVTMILTLIASAQIFWEYSNLMDPPFSLNFSHEVFKGLILISNSIYTLVIYFSLQTLRNLIKSCKNSLTEQQKLTLVCRKNNFISYCLLLIWGTSFVYWIKDGSLKTKIQDNTFSDNWY